MMRTKQMTEKKKKDRTSLLAYYTEYSDSEGKKHYAVHKYRPTDGWVWGMRDFKFPDMAYSKHWPTARPTASNAASQQNASSGLQNLGTGLPKQAQHSPADFLAAASGQPDWPTELAHAKQEALKPRPTVCWSVYDKDKKLIAKFFRPDDAAAYRTLQGYEVKEEEDMPVRRG